jgi:hypothetical protein
VASIQVMTPAEQKLIAAASRGEIADFSSIDSTENNPLEGARWPSDRTLSAEMVRILVTRTNSSWRMHPAGLRIAGARIASRLDLSDTQLGFPIAFVKCSFARELSLRGATVESVFLGGSDLPGLDARSLQTRGDVQLCDGLHVHEVVRFDRAIIGGSFSCNGALLDGHNGFALIANEIAIHGHMLLSNGFHASAEVSLRSARIGGMLYCSHAHFEHPGGMALALDDAVINGQTILSIGFTAIGQVSMSRAGIRRHLYCAHGSFKNPGGIALSLDTTEIGGRAFLGEWFNAKGRVCLCDAAIARDLYCVGGIFQNAGPGSSGDALCANRLNVNGHVRMDTRFLAQGAVRMADATIAGALDCRGGYFENAGGVALLLAGAHIGRDAVLGSGFRASGAVDFTGTTIGGTLETEGARYDELLTAGAAIGEP